MTYHEIPKETLDRWWAETKQQLEKNPKDWDAIRDQVLLENEYQRKGWNIPDEQTKT